MSDPAKAQHDPLVWALLLGGFVWIVFDSLFFGLIAGLLAYVYLGQKQTKKEDD